MFGHIWRRVSGRRKRVVRWWNNVLCGSAPASGNSRISIFGTFVATITTTGGANSRLAQKCRNRSFELGFQVLQTICGAEIQACRTGWDPVRYCRLGIRWQSSSRMDLRQLQRSRCLGANQRDARRCDRASKAGDAHPPFLGARPYAAKAEIVSADRRPRAQMTIALLSDHCPPEDSRSFASC
jgi:hypothetical protein